MSVIYTDKFLFTDIHLEDGREDGWALDCGGKMDFDPTIVRISSRVWPDGSYTSSVCVGGDTLVAETGIVETHSKKEAMDAVEAWANEQADKIIDVVKSIYSDGKAS